MKRIFFIINPISGIKKKGHLPELIHGFFKGTDIQPIIMESEYAGHAVELVGQALGQNCDAIVAVGGDGSLNEISGPLIGTSVPLGIIPRGSGNGLARHIGIPLKPSKCLEIIQDFNVAKIDVCQTNQGHFLSLAGLGFDAHVVEVYDRAKGRGFFTYAKSITKRVFGYPNFAFSIEGPMNSAKGEAFQINVSNSNQFGYNMKVAPLADLQDGQMVVSVTRPFPRWKSILLGWRLRNGSVHKSKYVEQYLTDSLKLKTQGPTDLQLDGEHCGQIQELEIKILPSSLNLICPVGSLRKDE